MEKTLGGTIEVRVSDHRVALDPHVVATFTGAGTRCAPFLKTPAFCAAHGHTKFLSNTIRFYLLDCREKRRNL